MNAQPAIVFVAHSTGAARRRLTAGQAPANRRPLVARRPPKTRQALAAVLSWAVKLRVVLAAADARRVGQVAVGLLWLLDGALQLQPFMYSGGLVNTLHSAAVGQPGWLAASIMWAAHVVHQAPTAWNTVVAVTQLSIGLALLSGRGVRAGLAVSVAWGLVIWWFGEAFGMLFMSMGPPLTGAPGAAILYVIAALILWPNDRPAGLLGPRGARTAWCVLWLVNAYLWLGGVSSAANSTQTAIAGAPSGASWLRAAQTWAAGAANGHGAAIALVAALLSAAIGIAVAADWHARWFLGISIVLSLSYWVLGQGFGGILTGTATDPNSGPLFVLLAAILYPLARNARPLVGAARPLVGGARPSAQAARRPTD